MINKNTFPELLKKLNFTKDDNTNIWSKVYNLSAYLKVDFDHSKIIYPVDQGFKVSGEFTTNFSSDENFVVLECVDGLLTKGYKPNHIELEAKWQLGHGASGGRADIVVKDQAGATYLIIECKTFGNEFNKAWENTKEYGGQIFSYIEQEKATKFVALYASDIQNGAIVRDQIIISHQDNPRILEENLNLKSFASANNFIERFQVWKETYSLEHSTRGIFEDSVSSYDIGKINYSLTDLQMVSGEISKKYNEFGKILRQHNVGGHENAFDKLVNLFLCKIVDEQTNQDNLQFYWKGISKDTPFDLQDRLQKLYQAGMKQFLGEDVTYIENSAIDEAFRFHKKSVTKEVISGYIKELKFFSNNDFAFINVHNEKLFYQNSEVLLKIVKMLQDIRLTGSNNDNQFLGDLFEGFLDNGVKQSEGQFFTPMPIVKYIVDSLPTSEMITKTELPIKVIDYACGSGHFLTEIAKDIANVIKDDNKVKEFYENIYGIEKEYRLSKVSKVSAFMYGQNQIKILYADALASNPEIKENSFDVLVANPPFSVSGFLSTLSDKDKNRYELTKSVSEISTNKNIEGYFIELTQKLLKSGGAAAIVLPSSILSNDKLYIKIREIILKYFHVIAITELPPSTFGKTGTNTIVLFLEKRLEKPFDWQHWRQRIEIWFENTESAKQQQEFQDESILPSYCDYIGVSFELYQTLITRTPSPDLQQTDKYQEYVKAFAKTQAFKNIYKKRITESYKSTDKDIELAKKELDYIIEIEKEKILYYILATTNRTKVLVTKSPSVKKDQKKFLGYEWSNRKGSEGIKYLSQGAVVTDSDVVVSDDIDEEILEQQTLETIKSLSNICTPLYDPQNKNDNSKINYLVRNNFLHTPQPIPANLIESCNYIELVDMLDFDRVEFIKNITLSPKKGTRELETSSKYPLMKLGEVCQVLIGGTPSRSIQEYFGGENLWVSISEMKGQTILSTKEKITDQAVKNSNVKLIPKNTTLVSFKLSIGKTAVAGVDLYTNEAIAGIIPKSNILLDAYIYSLFSCSNILSPENVGSKAFGKSLNSEYLKNNVKIPVPPMDIQEQIVEECEAVDQSVKNAQDVVDKLKSEINKKITSVGADSIKIFENLLVPILGFKTKIEQKEILNSGLYPVITQEQSRLVSGYTNNIEAIDDLPLIVFGDHSCNYKYIDFPFIRGADGTQLLKFDDKVILTKFALNYLKTVKLENQEKYERHYKYLKNLKIPVPSLEIQNQIVADIEILEQQISDNQVVIDGAKSLKQEILNKYLN